MESASRSERALEPSQDSPTNTIRISSRRESELAVA